MRMIGRIDDERRAAQFSDILFAHDIENEIEAGQSGWIVWIVDDEHLADAKALLERFTLDPDNEAFQKASREGRRKWGEARREELAPRPPVTDIRTQMHQDRSAVYFPLTIGMVLVSIGIYVMMQGEHGARMSAPLFFTEYIGGSLAQRISILSFTLFNEFNLWRIVTPIFLHFSIMHILFNMMWLVDLGRSIESRRGSLYFAALVLAIAIPSNLAQYLVTGPRFGGMSGVVFGLIGYMWTRNRFSYEEIYPLKGSEMQLMVVWFFVCAFGLVGHVANWAHGVGLAVGMLIGYLFSHKFRRLFHRKA